MAPQSRVSLIMEAVDGHLYQSMHAVCTQTWKAVYANLQSSDSSCCTTRHVVAGCLMEETRKRQELQACLPKPRPCCQSLLIQTTATASYIVHCDPSLEQL